MTEKSRNVLSRVADVMYKTKMSDTTKWMQNQATTATKRVKNNINTVLGHNLSGEQADADITKLNFCIIDYDADTRTPDKKTTSKNQLKHSVKIYIELPGVASDSIHMSFFMSDLIIRATKPRPYGSDIVNEEDRSDDLVPPPAVPPAAVPGASVDAPAIMGNMKYGSIYCVINLPIIVNCDKDIAYNYANGILKITIPKACIQDPVVIKYKKRSKHV